MPDEYYVSIRSGESYAGATAHPSRDCDDLPDDPTPRPVRAGAVEDNDDVDVCGACSPLASGSDGGGEAVTERCQTVMGNDEICGRELPCQYHSD